MLALRFFEARLDAEDAGLLEEEELDFRDEEPPADFRVEEPPADFRVEEPPAVFRVEEPPAVFRVGADAGSFPETPGLTAELRLVDVPRFVAELLLEPELLFAVDVRFAVEERFAVEVRFALEVLFADVVRLLVEGFADFRFSAAASDAFFAAARFFNAVPSTLFAAPAAPCLPADDNFSCVLPLVFAGPL